MKIIIDGKKIASPADFHDEIEKISPIIGYGRNLDALYDALTSVRAEIKIKHTEEFKRALGEYGEALMEVIEEARAENDFLEVEYE